VDGVVFYSNSRMTRRPLEYEIVIELVETTGVRLASVASGSVDLATADGRMIGRMLAAQDAAEAERISERVCRAFAQRREVHGRPHATGMRPFGFRPGGEQVEPTEAEAIRRGVRMVLDGASLGDVLRAWTEAGIRPVREDHWTRATVRRALTRPRIAGLVEHRGQIIGEGRFEVIIDRTTWEQVRAAVSDRSGLVAARYSGREHLLSGFCYCGVCGSRMKVSARRDADGAVRADSFVSCVKETGGCGRVKRNLALAEEFLTGAVERRLADVRGFADLDDTDAGHELGRLIAERDMVDSKIIKLRERYETDPDFDAEDFVPMVRRLRNRLHELEAEIAGHETPTRLGDLGEDALATWQTGTLAERREILAALVEHVTLHPIGKVGPVRARAMVPATTEIAWR
jgi:site-specific DNA recombinase